MWANLDFGPENKNELHDVSLGEIILCIALSSNYILTVHN